MQRRFQKISVHFDFVTSISSTANVGAPGPWSPKVLGTQIDAIVATEDRDVFKARGAPKKPPVLIVQKR